MDSIPKTKTLVVLGGPTASGKTATAARLASHFNSEVISADARQIYREMKIGTAVPDPEELLGVPHHFLQTVSLKEDYNASRYESEVLALLEKLFTRHSLLFLAGGSGLYIDAVCKGIDDLPSHDPRLREQLAEEYRIKGLEHILGRLKELDPVSYARIDLNNPMRVLKAVEVSLQTGRPYSAFLSRKPKERPFSIIRMALNPDREDLYKRINSRVDVMLEKGLEEEARQLYPLRGYTALKTVGYREFFRYFDGEISREEAIDLIRRNTRKYARKQITWFRKDQQYNWFLPDDFTGMTEWITSCLKV